MYAPSKKSLMDKFRKKGTAQTEENAVAAWAKRRDRSCYICKRFEAAKNRYYDTFFYMYKKDGDLYKRIEKSKGFCLHHFGEICGRAEKELSGKQKEEFYPLVFHIMEDAMERVAGDINWLVEKFDYKNQDADWKNSKDAIQRGIQKLRGGYPADLPHKK